MEEKKWYQQKVKEVENKLETNKEKGLTEEQVKEKLQRSNGLGKEEIAV